MITEYKTTNMVRVYRMNLEDAIDIIKRKYALSEKELLERKKSQEYDIRTYFEKVRPESRRTFDAAALTGVNPASVPLPQELDNLIFPSQVRTSEHICFCSGLVWEIVPGDPGGVPGPKLILKCEYFCFSLASIA